MHTMMPTSLSMLNMCGKRCKDLFAWPLQAGLQTRTSFETVARGGRYDNLLQRLRLRQHRLMRAEAHRLPPLQELMACGVQVDVARLVEGASGEKPRKETSVVGVEVVVCGSGVMDAAEYLKEAFSAAKALRASGLRVGLLYDYTLAGDALREQLKRLQPAWVLFVKPLGQLLLSSFAHRISREIGRDHLGKVALSMVRGQKDRPGASHHEAGPDTEEVEEGRGDLGLQVTVLPTTFQGTTTMSASTRRQLASSCQRAFASAVRPPLPHCLALCCGFSLLDIRTAVNFFHELVPISTDSRYKQMQPLVTALQEATQARKHTHLFVYSYPEQRFEMVLGPSLPPRREPVVHSNKKRTK
eukprot:GGOE01040524.1.p1 GENE.GGOE01040524.1~~GGOE01040524.1.p1  ORF type:complete len:366 (-),score=106.05 GGOE01040524.1:215-1285(-)